MDDSSTLKQGSYFAIGIGIVIFILGIAAYLYFQPGGQFKDLPDKRCKCK